MNIYRYFLLFFFFIFTLYSVNGQSFINKYRLKRTASLVNKNNIHKAKLTQSKIHFTQKWQEKNQFFYNYLKDNSFVDSIRNSLEILTASQLETNKRKVENILKTWKELSNDTNYLIKKGYKIEPFYSLSIRISRLIDKIKLASASRENYENPKVFDSLVKMILPEILESEVISPSNGKESPEYLIEIIKDGKNLIVKLKLYYKENLYGYPLGRYQSPAIDYPIRIFSKVVADRIEEKSILKVTILGEADANKPDRLRYNGNNLGNIDQDSFLFNYLDEIDNNELAYLRAYNSQQIFTRITNKLSEPIQTKDHLKVSKTHTGQQFRKVTMTAFFFGYFTKEYDKLSDDDKETIDIQKRTIIIKNDRIIY